MKSRRMVVVLIAALIGAGIAVFSDAGSGVETQTAPSSVFLPSEAEIEIKSKPRTRGFLAATYSGVGTPAASSQIVMIDFSKIETNSAVSFLAPSEFLSEYPSISPDGRLVAFYSDRSGDREIFVVPTDGGTAEQITNYPGIDEDPSWSPAGDRIVFHRSITGDEKQTELFVMSRDGATVRQLTSAGGQNSVPRFSPDGRAVIFTTDRHWPGWDIESIDIASSEISVLTSGLKTSCRGNFSLRGEILYAFGSGNDIDLWLMNGDGSQKRVLISRPGRNYDGVFTSDGDGIFFVGEMNRGKGDFQIFFFDRTSGEITQVTEAPGAFRHLSWWE